MLDTGQEKVLKKKHKDISRIDQEAKKTHGWYVRVRYFGKTHSKFFSDGKCGGKAHSLLAAIAWRDAVEVRLGKRRTNRHMVTVCKNKTGIVGVRLNEMLNRYEVSWVDKYGKQGKTSVSVKKYGRKEAFSKACAIRKQKEIERLTS